MMSWLRSTSWFARIILPVNVLVVVAIGGFLKYPVFRLKTVEVSYADGRIVAPEMYEQVCHAVKIGPDSNLFSIEPELVARLMMLDENLAKVDVRLELPDRVQVRLAAAEPVLWWADRRVAPVAGDGRPVAAAEETNYPVGIVSSGRDSTLFRWRLLEMYQKLVRYDSRWAEVVSQVAYDSTGGWHLVLNGGGERILLGRQVDSQALDRLTRFLERIPEKVWQHTNIDARFSESIVLTPQADSSDTGHVSVRAAERDSTNASSEGRS